MSNSKYMSAGAAYGSGIYFADSQSMSLGYCTNRNSATATLPPAMGSQKKSTNGSSGEMRINSATGWQHSRFYRGGQGTICMALCEVVDNRSKFTHATGGIFVVPQEEYVVTRYFLVNPSGSARASKLNLSSTTNS